MSSGFKGEDTRLPTFIVLSFEGPDAYARAGGLGARVTELTEALARAGHETHLFFVGDPQLPGHESRMDGRLQLHRWCQWISQYHPGGVYDGEDGKLNDWNQSLVPWLDAHLLQDRVQQGHPIVVLAEEWQTAASLIALARLVRDRGWLDRVHLFWNANHFFGLDRIDWPELRRTATVTTVSRYMRQALAQRGVDARVVPNGLSDTWFRPLQAEDSRRMRFLTRERLSLLKVARWDPDKGWTQVIRATSELKDRGFRPLLLAWSGNGPYERQVLRGMRGHGLDVGVARWQGEGPLDLAEGIRPVLGSDVVLLSGFLSLEQRRVLYRNADVVLANSSMEPFGLVGLETMAVGGIAFVGSTGEDYATPGHDAVCIETSDPREIVANVVHLRGAKHEAQMLRERARRAARRYAWPQVLKGRLLPLVERSSSSAPSPSLRHGVARPP